VQWRLHLGLLPGNLRCCRSGPCAFMRRNCIGIVLFALALLGRLVLPLAAEAHTADPLADAPICTHDGSAVPPSAPEPLPDHRSACDALCCTLGAAFAPPVTLVIAVVHASAPATWRALERTQRAPRLIARQPARGPPKLS
jgi:hypothetical protein